MKTVFGVLYIDTFGSPLDPRCHQRRHVQDSSQHCPPTPYCTFPAHVTAVPVQRRYTYKGGYLAAILFIVKAMKPPATPAEIARWLFRKPHTVGDMLCRMENQGLVRMVKNLQRKNMIRVTITEKGEEVFQRSREMKTIHNSLSCLSAKEQDDLRAYLERVRNRALEEVRVTPKLPFP